MRPRRLLLVEDHPDTVAFLERRLTEEGYKVEIARRGEDAMMALRKRRKLDIVVMDLNLPNMDGDDIVSWMRQQPRSRRTPVVFVTADSAKRVAHLLDEDTTRCLEKPLATKVLLATLEDLLARAVPDGKA
ncbi:MAG: response regulator [Candidatus Sericytochromatia bacterium]|nr:response regulator [Candidatus Tanganyikabacteria bacterium]